MNDETNTAVMTRQEAEPSPMAMIAEGMRMNLDVAKMNALMDFKERVEKSEAEKLFNAAMARCQAEMPTVVKDRENSHTRSRYATLEQVQRTIKPTYLRHGFSITISEADAQRPELIRVKLVLRHAGGHSETFYREGANDSKGAKGGAVKTDLQGAQSTVSYLARNMLLAVFGVTVSEQDIDGNATDDFIGDGQKAEVARLLKESGADVAAFLDWLQVDDIATIPTSKYGEAVAKLKLKISKNGGVK